MAITIYTDGACEGNQYKNNVGGWAYIILGLESGETLNSGAERNTTNNKMELIACISALNYVRDHIINQTSSPSIQLYSDSEYVVKGVKEWRKSWERSAWKNSRGEPVKNKDLWIQLFNLFDILKFSITHVRGHSGNPYNERVDVMAVNSIKELKK